MTPADCVRHLQRSVQRFLPLNSALVKTKSTTALLKQRTKTSAVAAFSRPSGNRDA